MSDSPAIRLLAAANNERGDLFTRLTKDLFFALGYDNLRLDVHKSGRELDIQGEHRFEPRRVVAECKAHAAKMGGDDLNKLFGALNRERKKSAPIPVAGYFVSLGGFTETGIEQEIETGDERVILLDSQKVVEELENCRAVVERTAAAERAGHCAQYAGLQAAVLDGTQLLGHQRGYVWSIFYAHDKERTHFALIHADGTPLAETVAREVIEADRLCNGVLHSLQYLAPPVPPPDRIAIAAKAAVSYRQWLGEECGYIHLDGLPADTDLSATRLKLERLFVPLKATLLPKPGGNSEVAKELGDEILSIGELMERSRHLALLAVPGGGKSTLVKRLASAYAFPERRAEVTDNLPQKDFLPLILRCRELRDRAHRPIIELLDDIPRHAGMGVNECSIFQESIHTALRAGKALLLIDGLDEISDEGARQTFANHLRTFLAMFPQIALVVTSREAGFRLVAGVVASACQQAKLSPLNEDDVLSLCERWHVEVIGDNDKVRAEALELGQSIWNNERIRKLAENPLLLTTLLVVKRWVGELPRSRAALYREAIRVLVRTWNVEGYAPLDEDETLAQLSYVACAMMEEGQQQIGQKALLKLLQVARRELEAELQFARISPQEFIDRIEYRSSLLMQTGHELIDGILQPVYEFRHLTFQEYLTARGYVEEQYPGRDSGKSLADILEPHFSDERWREVIPLAAVLAGRKAEDLMKRLIRQCEGRTAKRVRQSAIESEPLGLLLYQCIRDEVQVTAPTLRVALRELAREVIGEQKFGEDWVSLILKGKFGALFQETAEQAYYAGTPEFEQYCPTLVPLAMLQFFRDQEPLMSTEVFVSLRKSLESGDRLEKIRAALICMNLAFSYREKTVETATKEYFQIINNELYKLLGSDNSPLALAASVALAWIGQNRLLTQLPEPEIIQSLFQLWRQEHSIDLRRYFAWALGAQPLLPRDTFSKEVWGDCDEFLLNESSVEDFWYYPLTDASLTVGWYRRAPWNDDDLAEQISKHFVSKYKKPNETSIKILESLGNKGKQILEKWKQDYSLNLMDSDPELAKALIPPPVFILPPLPPAIWIGRDGAVNDIKHLLELKMKKKVVVVRGWPGVGKTTLINVLARDPEITKMFPQGVLWTSLGIRPHLLSEMASWGRALGTDEILRAPTMKEAVKQLSAILQHRQMLLIVDEVWDSANARPFIEVMGDRCVLVVTTRITSIGEDIASDNRIYNLSVLIKEDALKLLRTHVPNIVAQYEEECRELVRDIEGLPLAIQVAGSLLKSEAHIGLGVRELIQEIRDGAKLIPALAPLDCAEEGQILTVQELLMKSINMLDDFTRDCFAYLGAFAPKPATFDLAAMQAVWEVDDAKPIVRQLVNHGLLEPVGAGHFQMHRILVNLARKLLDT